LLVEVPTAPRLQRVALPNLGVLRPGQGRVNRWRSRRDTSSAARRHGGRDHPGWLRSEMMLDNFGVSEANWRDAINRSPATARLPLPRLRAVRITRATWAAPIVALASDPNRSRWNQKSVSSGASRHRVRLHGCGRLPPKHLALHGRSPRGRDQRNPNDYR
jgi:hypothetical protein